MSRVISLLCWLPAVLWYRLIWNFSAQTAAVSGDLSDRLLWRILNRTSPAFAAADTLVQDGAVELLSFFERKAAHMFLYFVLVLLLLLALRCLRRRLWTRGGWAAGLCLLLAALDEYHQTLVPGRAGQLRDVVIDMTGALLALGLTALILWLRRTRAQARGFSPWGLLPAGVTWAAMAILPRLLETSAGLPAVRGLAQRFIDGFSTLAPAAQESLLLAMQPVAVEALLLFLAGLLGAASVLSAALSGLSLQWLFPGVLPLTAFLCALFCRQVWTCVAVGILGGGVSALLWLLAHHWHFSSHTLA